MLTKKHQRIDITIEEEKDFENINKLLIEAFKNEKHSNHDEHLLVQKLRKSSSYLPRLTLTAKINDELVGFIMFTKAYIGDYEVLALAPLAVSPKYQNQKIGTFLINYGHEIATKYGYTHSIVLCNPKYYSRFGYKNAATLGIKILLMYQMIILWLKSLIIPISFLMIQQLTIILFMSYKKGKPFDLPFLIDITN